MKCIRCGGALHSRGSKDSFASHIFLTDCLSALKDRVEIGRKASILLLELADDKPRLFLDEERNMILRLAKEMEA